MDGLIDPAELNQLIEQVLAFVQTEILVLSNLVQFAALAATYFAARLLSKPLDEALDKILAADWVRKYRVTVTQTSKPLVMPLVWLVLTGTAGFLIYSVGWAGGILNIVSSLLTAWIAIRLLLNFIADPWWSRAVAVSVWSVAALNIVGLLDPTLAFIDEFAIQLGEFRLSLLVVAKGIVALVVLLWAANWLSRWVEARLKGIQNFSPSQKVLFGKLARVAFIAIAILIAINSVGIDLTALAVFSGALGLGIGFGLQKVVGNLLSGVILLMDRSVKPGDVVSISGTYGWINAIGARYVSVVTRDGIEHLIPNEVLISTPVENWSHSDRLVRQRLPVGISYESDVHLAIKLCEDAASEFDRVLKDPAPKCLLKGYGDNALNLELRVWIQDAEKGVSNIKSEIFLRIHALFQDHGVAFPYPQRDIHVKGPVRLLLDGTLAPEEPEHVSGALEGGQTPVSKT
ncbi:mechanosensitive ion channel domain-containing protein [Magnetovibrio sp. PR-2]|uniref:mechanosensitive ion channel family protein n=1 Tax=Magnetovibrio sp. PR-2 TaxID=3120356 RepID=UPI002FCE06CD